MWLFSTEKSDVKVQEGKKVEEVRFEKHVDVEMTKAVVVEAKVEERKAGELALVVKEGTEMSLDGRMVGVETKMEEFKKDKHSLIMKEAIL